jgi:hypothetical protein
MRVTASIAMSPSCHQLEMAACGRLVTLSGNRGTYAPLVTVRSEGKPPALPLRPLCHRPHSGRSTGPALRSPTRPDWKAPGDRALLSATLCYNELRLYSVLQAPLAGDPEGLKVVTVCASL